MKGKRLIAAAVSITLACGAAAGGIYGYKAYQKKNLVVDVVSVSYLNWGYYGDTETSYGIVTNDSAQEIYLDSSNTVAEVYVAEGDTVEEGAPLLRYDRESAELEIQRKQLDISNIQNDIAIAQHELEELRKITPVSKEQPAGYSSVDTARVQELKKQIEELEDYPEKDTNDSRIYNYVTAASVPYNADTADGTKSNPYIYYCNKNAYAYGSFFNSIRPKSDGTAGKYVKFIICKKDSDGKMVFEDVEDSEDSGTQEGSSETQVPWVSGTEESQNSETRNPEGGEIQNLLDSETEDSGSGTAGTEDSGDSTAATESAGDSGAVDSESSETESSVDSGTEAKSSGSGAAEGSVDSAAQDSVDSSAQVKSSGMQGTGNSDGPEGGWTEDSGDSGTEGSGLSESQGTDEIPESGEVAERGQDVGQAASVGLTDADAAASLSGESQAVSVKSAVADVATSQSGESQAVSVKLTATDVAASQSGTAAGVSQAVSVKSVATDSSVSLSGTALKTATDKVPVADSSISPNTISYNGNNLPTTYDASGMWYIFSGKEVEDVLGELYDELDEAMEEEEWEEPEGYTKEELDAEISEQEEELKKLDLELRREQLQLESLEAAAEDGIVYAKLSGVVKTVGDPEVGTDDGTAFLVLTDDDGLYVKGTISELLLDEVSVGTIVTANSWETGMSFEATITEILDYPVEGDSWGEGNPNVSYYQYVAYIEDSSGLKNGESVDLTIDTGQSESEEDGIYIEKAYVREEDGKSYCMIADEDGFLKKQYVTTGKTIYGEAIEIKSGLTESDLIAFPYGKNAVEGAAVTETDSFY